MADPRCTETLEWFEAHAAEVEAHPGAAYAELQLLKMIVAGDGFGGGGLLGESYRKDLLRKLYAVADRGEAYRLTHAVLFASNFGRVAIPDTEQSAAFLSDYGALLDSLVVTYAEDTDLLGELLIGARCIDHSSNATVSALETFETASAALDRDNFAESYHPILIGAMLFKMLE